MDEFYGQHIWKEILCDPVELSNFAALSNNVDEQLLSEAKMLVREHLIKRLKELATEILTTHQKTVFELMMKGYTYDQMATKLEINYTAISHAIKGIKLKRKDKHHGGIEKKISKAVIKDDVCKDLLSIMNSLKEEEDVKLALSFLRKHDVQCVFDVNLICNKETCPTDCPGQSL